MIPNHYKILGINRKATDQEIKKAYRKLALEWHPDKNNSPNAHEMFIKINKGYLILSDSEARAKYNKEYDFYYVSEEQKSKYSTEFDNRHTTKGEYEDEDLNNWSSTAEKQSEKFASMNFDDFSEIVKNIAKEVGVQGATAFIYAIAGIVGLSSLISFFSGIYYGDIPQIIFSIILFSIAVVGINFTSKKYNY